MVALASDSKGQQRTSTPMHIIVKDASKPWTVDKNLLLFEQEKTNAGSKNAGKEITEYKANKDTSNDDEGAPFVPVIIMIAFILMFIFRGRGRGRKGGFIYFGGMGGGRSGGFGSGGFGGFSGGGGSFGGGGASGGW